MQIAPAPMSRLDRLTFLLRLTIVAVLAADLAFFVASSLHWPLLVDSPVLHYVNFLIDHGLRPYQDITDNNLPGALLTERTAMFLFGPGDLAWRFYDFFLLAVLTGSMMVIAWPYDRFAGFYAGALFALRHGSEGAWFAGEREQAMATLLIASVALLFLSVRHRRPLLTGGFGLLASMAASIKPTMAPFSLLVLLSLPFLLRRRQLRARPYLLWGIAGLLITVSINLGFLLHFHALQAFLFVSRLVTLAYLGLNQPGTAFLVRHVLPDELFSFLPFGLAAGLLTRSWSWERSVLLLGATFGLLSYFLQQKGFFHHRYLFLSFLLLLAAIEIFPLLSRSAPLRLLGAFALVFPLVLGLPFFNHQFRNLPGYSPLTGSLEADLTSLGLPRLQREVQCFDMTFGCLNSLYHLHLVENTGYTGDMLLFQPGESQPAKFYRARLAQLQAQNPADVFVVTNENFGHPRSFDRLNNWPDFVAYLDRDYTLAISRCFPREDIPYDQPALPMEFAPGYRIYLRKGSALTVPSTPVAPTPAPSVANCR